MTDFAHAVNFTMSFGVTVLPEDINELRKKLQGRNGDLYDYQIYNIKLTKNSTDEELANYLGLQNYRDWMLSECLDMEMEEHHVYDAKNTKRLSDEYQHKLKDFRESNANC